MVVGGPLVISVRKRKSELPWQLSGKKNPPANAGDAGSIPGLGISPGEGNSNPLQYSCLGNRMNRGGWRATVHDITEELDIT